MKITYLAATSEDGFIAKEDGDVSWLDDMNVGSHEQELAEFFNSVDALVMGRNTYDFVFNYGSWPYENKPTWVCTHRELQSLPGANLIIADDINRIIADARSSGHEHLWLVGGGQLASAFVDRGLLTHLSISEMPIKLGSGIPLFAEHRMSDIPAAERTVREQAGFRQIDVAISLSASP